MAIHIQTINDKNILEVIYTSEEVSKKDLSDHRNLVAEEIAKTGFKKVLIDATALIRFPPVFILYDHNVEISSQHILWLLKFAVVCNSLGEDERFLEMSGLNQGVQLKCFISRESALSWLENT